MRLLELFTSLSRPSKARSYSVAAVDSNCRVGRSYEGHPALLVALPTSNGARLPRRLANFAYHPPAAVEIRSGGRVESTTLAIVECCTDERRLASYFFRIGAEILVPEAASGDEAKFEAAIDAVVTLFKALQRPPTRTIQGLWAELATIAFASNPAIAVASWHSSSRSLHDFVNGSARLEVKSTTKSLREHTILLDQLTLGEPGTVLLASMLLSETSGGRSVFDLVELIREALSTREAQHRLETIVADSLGHSFENVEAHLYDLNAARETLQYFRADAIPTCPLPLPPEVKDVSFTVDLSTTPSVPLDQARAISPQFGELLPAFGKSTQS